MNRASDRVSPPSLRRILLGVVGVMVLMDLTSLGLSLRARAAGIEAYDYITEGAIGGVVIIAVALVLVLRRPDHPITWLFVAFGLMASLQQIFGAYAAEALGGVSGLSGGRAALAASNLFQSWFVMLFLLLVAVFPTGKPLAGWFGRVVWLIPVAMLIAVYEALTLPVEQGSITYPPLIDAPSLGLINFVLSALLILGVVVHVIVRYVRSTGIERQQLKWFVFAFVVGVFVLVLPWSESDTVGTVLWTLVPTSIVASIALAILRYRLYDIDRIISRTVAYALVIGVLGLTALALVSLLALFLPSDDPLVVAVATLAAAALFNPLRLRIQSFVDRRFNRVRYDSEKVIDEFTGSLRDRLNPEGVVDGWVGVVEQTMQPALVGVWVKE